MHVLLLLMSCLAVTRADFSCLCSTALARKVFSAASETASGIGFMYEFECKQIVSFSGPIGGWKEIAFAHLIGYIKEDTATYLQQCHGEPSTSDIITTTPTAVTFKTTTGLVTTLQPTIVTTTPLPSTVTTTPLPTTVFTTPLPTIVTTTPLSTPVFPDVTTIATSLKSCPLVVQQEAKANNSILIINNVENKCYKFVTKKTTWSSSEDNCERNGGHLVTVRTENENNEIYEYIKAYGDHVWLGLNDKQNEQNFTWVSGEGSSYTNWKPGHYNAFIHGSEDCVVMLATSGKWEDLMCSFPYASICEYDSVIDNSGQSLGNPSLNSDGNIHMCPTSAILRERFHSDHFLGQYGDSCYELINGSHVPWPSAEYLCNQNGGHLAHIRNVDEQNYIYDFLKRHASNIATWIGLSDSHSENHFEWTSGEPVTYTNWMSGYNGTRHSSEDCVVFLPNNTGKWDEVYCDSYGGFFIPQIEKHQQLCQYKTVTHPSSILIG